MPNKDKLFLLGVGAQKSGTTWLYKYLSSAGNVATDGVKEYHVWDVVHLPDAVRVRVTREQSTQSLGKKIQYALQQRPSAYFDYFRSFLENTGKQVTCDITPGYAALGSAVLQSIAGGFADRAIATRAVFLMRDPVDRCWSAARMQGKLRTGNADVSEEQVLAHAASPGAQMRTRYDLTLAELHKAFAPADVHVGIYEEMFRPDEIARLSAFCNVEARPQLGTAKAFAGPPGRSLSEETVRTIARQYRQVYDDVASRYPQVRELWQGYRYL